MSLHQPEPLSYLAGVAVGDAWCTDLTLGLRVADLEFSVAFAWAVADVFGVLKRPARDERGYWLVRYGNKTGRFNAVRSHEPETTAQRAAWLRGLFDSEGNANLVRAKISAGAFSRRVAFYSTNRSTLDRAAGFLACLGLSTTLRAQAPSATHKGSQVVMELGLRHSRESFVSFANKVGSSITRKRRVLDAIPLSYQPDRAAFCRSGQAKGAAVRRARRDAGGVY